jgi:hypothetical protein
VLSVEGKRFHDQAGWRGRHAHVLDSWVQGMARGRLMGVLDCEVEMVEH